MSAAASSPAAAPRVLVDVRGLQKHFPVTRGVFARAAPPVRAVDGISFQIMSGETLGLVGESGSGKTTVGRTILRLIEPTSGAVVFDGTDLGSLKAAALRRMRRHMQIIFQDPYSSLNPRMTIGSAIAEPLAIHGLSDRKARITRVNQLLEWVGLDPGYKNRYPHEFSGGQRQRVGVARAIATNPRFIVCDEPVSALDVSVQAQVINLLAELQERLGLTYLFIAHDLAVVEHLSTRVAVMYLGKIVELATSAELYGRPLHPYTQALLSAIPVPVPGAKQQRIILAGDIPSPSAPPPGCRFHTRCPIAQPRCSEAEPPLVDYGGGHLAACYFTGTPVPAVPVVQKLANA